LDDLNPLIAYLTYGSVQYTATLRDFPTLDYEIQTNPAYPPPLGFKPQGFHILRDQVFRCSNPQGFMSLKNSQVDTRNKAVFEEVVTEK
jgi:hypothetical protein